MSTKLSHSTRAECVRNLTTLLARTVRLLDCPLTEEEMKTMWESALPGDYRAAVECVMEHRGQHYGNGQFYSQSATLAILDTDSKATFLVQLFADTMHQQVYMDVPNAWERGLPAFKQAGQHGSQKAPYITTHRVVELFGETRAAAYREWLQAFATLAGEVQTADRVISEIMDMVKTAGQLKRMVPELLQYLSPSLRTALDDQKRSSTIPFEWAGYDKKDVAIMLGVLYRCYLLPETGALRTNKLDVGLNYGNVARFAEAVE